MSTSHPPDDPNPDEHSVSTSQRVNLSEYNSVSALLKTELSANQSTRVLTLMEAMERQTPHPDLGCPAPQGCLLCPIEAISMWPFKSTSRQADTLIARIFFESGQFWCRTWHIFYAWPPAAVASSAVLLVPYSQVQEMLDEINAEMKTDLAITASDRQAGLVFSVPHHPDLEARFLGHLQSRDGFDRLQEQVPPRPQPSGSNIPMSDRAAFNDMMTKAAALSRRNTAITNAKSSKAEKKARQRVARRREHKSQLVELERLMGLRPPIYVPPDIDIGLDWAQETRQRELQAHRIAMSRYPDAIDVNQASPYPFEDSVVFVAIDLEWWERDSHAVTEIGVSTLDTADLVGVAPGLNGQGWESKIRARHFRVWEHRHLRNTFAESDPERFEFGQTAMILRDDTAQVIASCFKPPYSAHNATDEQMVQQRKVVLVGHDVSGDVQALRRLGYDVTNMSNLHDKFMDTSQLYRALTHEPQSTALGRVVAEFGFVPWNLHNAGNDAFYTMQALIAIALCNATEKRADKAHADSSKGTGYSSEEEW